MRFCCLPSNKRKKAKNEQYIDFTFDPGCVGFCTGLAIASPGRIHMSERCLSGQGQEEA